MLLFQWKLPPRIRLIRADWKFTVTYRELTMYRRGLMGGWIEKGGRAAVPNRGFSL